MFKLFGSLIFNDYIIDDALIALVDVFTLWIWDDEFIIFEVWYFLLFVNENTSNKRIHIKLKNPNTVLAIHYISCQIKPYK